MTPNGTDTDFRWDEELEGPARHIAATDESPLRVLAGPGTGKTYALMRRVARLLQEDEHDPERIFVCTFARTAARDLQKELQDLDVGGAQDVYAATLHSFCFSVLRREAVLEATGRVPRTLMRFERRFLIEDLSQQDDDFGGVRATRERLRAFNAAWARRLTDEPGWTDDPVDQKFGQALTRWLRFHECMHIGEVVPITLEFLRHNPAAPEHRRFDTILVDEYQDLNRAEQTLLDILAENADITVVGDEDQSIYSFKYAHPEGIREFAERHNGTTDASLEDCRRCPRLVVRLASNLIRQNETRANRGFEEWDDNPEGRVRVVQWNQREDEARGLAEWISRQLDDDQVDQGEVLVLTQSRQLGHAIQQELSDRDVQAHSFFAEQELTANPKELEGSEAQRAFTLLSLLADPEDRVALRAWCGFGGSTLYSGGWRQIVRHCRETGQSPREALAEMDEGDLTLPYQTGPVERYQELQHRLDQVEDLTGMELLNALFPPEEEWAESFRAYAEDMERDYEPAALHQEMKSALTQPELPMDVDYVRIMSLHKSKGLSADLVIIAGCVDGLIPRVPDDDLSPTEAQRHLEEQRRLFYVGVTRTREELVLSSFTAIERSLGYRMGLEIRGRDPRFGRTQTSRFLQELGPELPQAIRGATLLQTAP